MILVTGGTGFLGGYVIKELISRGYAVRAIRRSTARPFFIPDEILDQVQWCNTDVLDPVGLAEAMEGVEAIVHAAALVSFHGADRRQLEQVNTEGTRNVVNIALEQRVPRLVHVSSVAALGRHAAGETVNEKQKWDPEAKYTAYAHSKHLAEIEVWRGFAEGLTGVIVNPSTVIGYGDWNRSSNAIFKSVYKEFPWYSEGINGFVGVEDCARAIADLLFSPVTEQRFILNSEDLSYHQLFDLIADGFGKKRPWREATPFLGGLAWRLEAVKGLLTGRRPLLTRETARVAQGVTHYSYEKLLKYLPHFRFTPIAEVVKAACPRYLQAISQAELSL